MTIAHIYNGELGFDVRTKLNALIDQVAGLPAGGTGDVVGPASAIADAVAVYNGTTGKLIKDGGATIASIIASAVAASGTGDVVGPASAIADRIATYNGVTGKLIQDGGMTIADVIAAGGGGGMAIGGAITGGTAGRVLFAGVGGILDDDSTFIWNDTLKDLAIGGAYYVNASRALYVVPHVTENNWFEGNAGNQTISGYGNFGTGDLALSLVTSGYDNVAVGTHAMWKAATAYQNLALGSFALRYTQTDSNNVAVGNLALQTLGLGAAGGGANQNNIAIGYAVMSNADQAYNNVLLGAQALSNVSSPYIAHRNTIIGNQAASQMGSGGGTVAGNTCIGNEAAFNLTGASNYNTFIGGWKGPVGAGVMSNRIAFSEGSAQYALLDWHITKDWTWTLAAFPGGIPTALNIYNKQQALGVAGSNYERAVLDWNVTTDVFTIGTQAAGTGVVRPIRWTGLSSKATPIGADSLLLLDSASSGDMKTVLISTLPGGGGGSGSTILSGSGVPSDSLGTTGDYYVDEDGNQLYGPKAAPGTSFGPDQIAIPPSSVPTDGFAGPIELGNHLKAAVAGHITAVRYWRSATATQIARTVQVWTTSGTLLGSGSTVNDGGGTGWKQITLTTPVVMAANDVVVVAVGATGPYSRIDSPTYPVSNGGDVSIINGSYSVTVGAFPNNIFGANFFIDAVFQAEASLWVMAVDGDVVPIGGSVTSGVSGSVLFVDSSLNLAQDATFFWDNALNDLHIGGAYYVNAARALYIVPHITENNWFEGNAGNQTVTGYGNFATGDLSLSSVTSGYQNVAMGTKAMEKITAGFDNMAFGTYALRLDEVDSYNVAIGFTALSALGQFGAGGGSANIAIGYSAMGNMIRGDYNIGIGYLTMNNVTGTSVATNNILIGNGAGDLLGSGGGTPIQFNTLVGPAAGANLTGTSSRNTFLGGYRGPSATATDIICLSEGGGQYFLFDANLTSSHMWSFANAPGLSRTMLHIYNNTNAPGSPGANYERALVGWEQSTGNFFVLGTQAVGGGVKRLTAIDGFAKAGAPAAADLPASSFAVIDDTSAGQTWLVFNKAGTVRKVQLT